MLGKAKAAVAYSEGKDIPAEIEQGIATVEAGRRPQPGDEAAAAVVVAPWL